MNIKENHQRRQVEFSELASGEVFRWVVDGCTYMKTDPITSESDVEYNCVCLDNGNPLCFFRDTDLVFLFEHELTLF